MGLALLRAIKGMNLVHRPILRCTSNASIVRCWHEGDGCMSTSDALRKHVLVTSLSRWPKAAATIVILEIARDHTTRCGYHQFSDAM
jgi:hypothetical protein